MRRYLVLLTLCMFCPASFGQQKLRIMSWNVENLFDCQHDTLKQDEEFLPEGERKWTWSRYWRKQEDIARVIMAVGEDQPVDLIGLCEVENDSVMRDLCNRGALRALGYDYVMTESPDVRGVDVALMYQSLRFRLLGSEERRVPSTEHGLKPTRNILHVWGIIPSGDTLHIAVCHFPSRSGDRKQGDENRMLAANTLASLADSLGPQRKLLVMGDFNADPRDPIFKVLKGLTDLAPKARYPKEGTYRYQGEWSWIDHMLVSPVLADCVKHDGSAKNDTPLKLYTATWMQDKDSHGGWHPRRTYTGPAYHGGVSDHVPIFLDIYF